MPRSTIPPPNPVDLLFHGAGQAARHPEAVPNVGTVLHLTGSCPSAAELRRHVAPHLVRLPCLTHRLTGVGDTPSWTATPPDLAVHIREHRVPKGQERLEQAVRELLWEPLDEAIPAWRLIILHGHVPDSYALLYLTNHAVQDAAAIITVLETLFGPSLPEGDSSAVARGITRSRWSGPGQVVRALRHLARNSRPHGLWNSPAEPLSARRHVLWTEVPTEALSGAARSHGGSVNDIHLTALAHAVAQWAAEHRPRAAAADLPVMIPVNLRTPDQVGLPGNRFFLARIDLAGGSATPAERLRRTLAATAPLKSAGYKSVLHRLSTRLPRRVLLRLTYRSATPDRLTVVGSIFAVRHSLQYRQDRVHGIAPIICCPEGFPLTVGLFTYGTTSTACFQIDRALPGGEGIPARWREAVEELAGSSVASEFSSA